LKEGLDELDMIYVDERVLEIAFELAKTSNASGADTAIVACAVAVARESSKEVEFVTADSDQKNLVLSQEMGVIQLSGQRRVQTTDKEPRTKNYFRG
jgi:predicted nucleic acid-binding protein